MNKVLVLGASGATGRLVVQQLLHRGAQVVAIVRVSNSLAQALGTPGNFVEVEADISQLSQDELAAYLLDCDAVISCLGHNLSFHGVFGKPRLLVTQVVENVSSALQSIKPEKRVKFILMNTAGNSNRDIPEKPPFSQRCVIALLRLLLPPHLDNEKAADFLRVNIGQQHRYIEWVVVRPDTLTDEVSVTDYDVFASPIRNPIFDAGVTSRSNVANFITKLVFDSQLWSKWLGQMPLIYNRD